VGRANMIISQTPNSAAERKRVARLEVARRLYQALVAQASHLLVASKFASGTFPTFLMCGQTVAICW
jgi:hypothetical protein